MHIVLGQRRMNGGCQRLAAGAEATLPGDQATVMLPRGWRDGTRRKDLMRHSIIARAPGNSRGGRPSGRRRVKTRGAVEQRTPALFWNGMGADHESGCLP
jgi:hypothetical protein